MEEVSNTNPWSRGSRSRWEGPSGGICAGPRSIGLCELAPSSQLRSVVPQSEKPEGAGSSQAPQNRASISNAKVVEKRLGEVDGARRHRASEEACMRDHNQCLCGCTRISLNLPFDAKTLAA